MNYTIYKGDCLIEHQHIQNGSVDLILTDLPYGNMKGVKNKQRPNSWGNEDYLKWDIAIPPEQVFEIANRILRQNGKVVSFSQQPYTTELIKNCPNGLKHNYNMIWEKNDFANPLLCNKAPVSYYEDVLVFSKQYDTDLKHPLRDYFKLVLLYINLSVPKICKIIGTTVVEHIFYEKYQQFGCTKPVYNRLIELFKIDLMDGFMPYDKLKEIDNKSKSKYKYKSVFNLWEGNKYKSNILKYKKDYNGYHPTQKPVLLLEDLIKTFSNENDLVVDLTMGSGSTGVAALNCNRKFIGIEQGGKYFEIAKERLNVASNKLF